MFKNYFLLIFASILFFSYSSQCQVVYDFGFESNDSIVVQDSLGNQMSYPWVGGFNAVHFQSIDLDLDGKLDLAVFDVHGDKLYTFINAGDSGQFKYKYKPEYEKRFPSISGWMQCVDYDGDGRKDLYAYIPGGIALYRNISTSSTGLTFQMISPMLNYNSSAGFPVNIFVTAVDFPAIADIDFDGDMDILTFHILGTFVIFYKNMSQEIYGDNSHISFKEADKCWGKFAESEEVNTVFLNQYCNYKSSKSSSQTKHTGSTILPINLNGDTLMDIILGDVDFFTLNGLTNGGSRDTALIVSQDTLFPSYDTSINLVSFPIASYIDIDNDNVNELLVSTFETASYKPEAKKSVWLYENDGVNDFPVFKFQSRSFFQDQMIDVGDNAMPEIVDVDGDGLLDMLVTNYGSIDSVYFDMTWFILWTHKSSSITWYKNVGSSTAPSFKYMNGNIFNIQAKKLTGAKATFGDLDGDADMDMIIGSSDGKLIYYQNSAGPNNMMTFANPVDNFSSIDVGEFSAPELFDINGDSLLDLVIGNKEGLLTYYQNTGTKNSPVFTHITDSMGKVKVTSYWHYYAGYSVPEVYRDDRDSLVMMVGSACGKVFYFRDIAQNITGSFGLDSNLLYMDSFDTLYSVAYFMNDGNILEYQAVGMRSAPALADLNNDGYKDMIVGNFSGGLNYFKGAMPTGVGFKEKPQAKNGLKIYPNPASNYFIINFDNPSSIKSAHVLLYDINGNLVAERLLVNPSNTRLNFDYLNDGVYLIGIQTVETNGTQGFYSSKVMIVNN